MNKSAHHLSAIARNDMLGMTSTKPSKHTRKLSTDPEQIVKQLSKFAHASSSQFALIICDQYGEVKISSSSAFSGYVESWIPKDIRDKASQVAVSAAGEKVVRRRRDSLIERKVMAHERRQSMDVGPMDDCDEDYDDEYQAGDPSIQKHLQSYHENGGLPPPPPDDRLDARIRKRSAQDDAQTPRKKKTAMRREVRTSSAESHDFIGEPEPHQEFKPLQIGDAKAVETFYMTRLRQMQQLMCKVVAKAWIKVIEPKKQSNFPYNRGDESKPAWWPEQVRHKEPDHLMKPERLTLLLTMLRSRKVPISKLEAATAEVMVQIPNERVPLLEEIYRVAKQEERVRDGQMSGETFVYVAASEMIIKSPHNHKAPSPKLQHTSVTSPLSGGGLSVDRRSSIQSQAPHDLNMADGRDDMRVRSRMNSQDDIAAANALQRDQTSHNPYSAPQVTATMTAGIEYNPAYVPHQTPPLTDPQNSYMADNTLGMGGYFTMQQPPAQSMAPRHSISFPAPSPAPMGLQRRDTMPNLPQQAPSQTVYTWGGHMTPEVFSPYSPGTQQHPGHSIQHTNTQAGSNPTTPATASFQIPPPPQSMHQQGQMSGSGPHDHAYVKPDDGGEHAYGDSTGMGSQMRQDPGLGFTAFLQSDHLSSVRENSTDDDGGRVKLE